MPQEPALSQKGVWNRKCVWGGYLTESAFVPICQN